MGMTKPRQTGNVDLLNPSQRNLQNQIGDMAGQGLVQIDPNLQNNQLYNQASGALGNILRPQSQDELNQAFQSSIGDPTMRQFDRQIVPGIQQQYANLGAGRSSALNQALAQASTDLSTNLGSLRQDFLQRQQQQQIGAAGQAGALSAMPLQQLLGLLGPALQQSNQPIVQASQPTFLQQLMNAGVQGGTAYMGASRPVTNNNYGG